MRSSKMNASLDHVVIAENASEFSRLHDQNISLVLLPRPENYLIKKFFERIILEGFENLSAEYVKKPEIKKFFESSLGKFNTLAGYEATIADLCLQAQTFSEVSGKKKFDFALKKISDNDASAFHIDSYHLRLFTTYIGLGTVWTPNHNIDEILPNNNVKVKDPKRIEQMRPFWISFFKGEFYSGKKNALVHRSPELEMAEAANKVRLVYRINCD